MIFHRPKLKMNFLAVNSFFPHWRKVFSAVFTVLFISVFCFAQDGDAEKDPVKIFNQAQDAHEKGDFQTALKLYEEAIRVFPEFPEAEYQRGNILISLNKPVEAEKAFRRAVELREDWSLPMTSLGALLVERSNFAEAEKFLAKAVELDALNFLAYSALTDLRLQTKASSDILKNLLERVKFLTTKANATASIWASRASLETALGDKSAAKTSLSRAFSIDARNKAVLLGQAEIALSENDLPTAKQIAQKLANQAPDSSSVKFLRARILAADGKWGDALAILDSIENQTTEITALRNKILANDTGSIADLEKRLETDAKNAAVLGRLCTLLRVDKPERALDYCRRAYEAEPSNVSHAVGFGAALVQAKRYENAAVILRKIADAAPDNFTARANLATALFQIKRFDEAIKEYLWLTEKQPDLAVAYYFLAISYDSLGKYLDAMANYQQFLKLADKSKNQLEIEKVNLRLPTLQKQIKSQ
jgi:predicted Zn-dependent protease